MQDLWPDRGNTTLNHMPKPLEGLIEEPADVLGRGGRFHEGQQMINVRFPEPSRPTSRSFSRLLNLHCILSLYCCDCGLKSFCAHNTQEPALDAGMSSGQWAVVHVMQVLFEVCVLQ